MSINVNYDVRTFDHDHITPSFTYVKPRYWSEDYFSRSVTSLGEAVDKHETVFAVMEVCSFPTKAEPVRRGEPHHLVGTFAKREDAELVAAALSTEREVEHKGRRFGRMRRDDQLEGVLVFEVPHYDKWAEGRVQDA